MGKHKDLYMACVMAAIVGTAPLLMSNDYFIHIGCIIGINILISMGMHMVQCQ